MSDPLRAMIEEHGLGRVADRLGAIAMNSIRVLLRPVDERELEVGASKLGGLPDLPKGVRWPKWEPGWTEETLAFVAQLRLSDVAPYDLEGALPRSGILYFFYASEEQPWGTAPEERDAWRVFYHQDDPSTLRPRPAPESLSEDKVFPAQALAYRSEITLPPFDWECLNKLDLTAEEIDRYDELMNDLAELHEQQGQLENRLLGYPDQLQDNLQYQCQFAPHGLYVRDDSTEDDPRRPALAQGVDDWRLLLQVDSNEKAGMSWGDFGRLYYFIRREALAAYKFDEVWLALQSL